MIFLHYHPMALKSISIDSTMLFQSYQHQLASRPAGALMIFMHSRNAATGDKMYCMIPDPFPSTAFGKGLCYARLMKAFEYD